MTMLPVCSTISNSYYSNSQVYLYGVKGVFTRHSSFTFKCCSNPFSNPLRKFANQFLIQELPRPNPPTSPFIINSLKPADIYSEYLSKTQNQNDIDNDIFTGINESFSALVCNTDTAITNTLNTITSSAKLASNTLNESIDTYVNKFNQSVSSTFSGFSNNSKEVSSKAGVIAVDLLRNVILTTEDFLKQGAAVVGYGYESVKDILPPDVQNVLDISQDAVFYVLKPVGTTFQEIYVVFETSFGIDPNDPIVPFLLLVGTSTTLWVSYWILTYAGYAGDLSPNLTFQLLNGKESVALIDVRPEDFREKDGIPDLRRTARFRYATVAFPEVDANVKKLLKSGKDFDDALLAAVIRNLKVVKNGSKVIVMDADGTRSKGIARSLRKFGIKRPYLVQGGFRSWVQEGLRVKEPKPETTFTILNEEAEAILEDITPQQVIGYGVGFLAAAYALLEWETTLQLIALFGIGQTIYQRVASYENSKDFNQDVRQLLVPVKLGSQAISWAAGKLETNRNGLPTSPSSVNVQNRVMQAAAKHESQPSDSEESSTSSVNQNPDLSEA